MTFSLALPRVIPLFLTEEFPTILRQRSTKNAGWSCCLAPELHLLSTWEPSSANTESEIDNQSDELVVIIVL